MGKRVKGISIEIDGETRGLDKALSNVNKRSRDLSAELRDVDKLLKFNPGNADLIAQKQRLLGDQVENTAQKLEQLKDAQSEVNRQFQAGEISESQYRAFRREIVETESRLQHFRGQLQTSEQSIDNFGDRVENTGRSMNEIGEGLKNTGAKMSAGFTAPVVGGLVAVTKGTEDLREGLARLEQNATSAGVSSESMKKSLVSLNGVTGEADSNVEALSNLLASGFDEQGMKSAVDALSGAVIKFPDTMKIEGLADGLQETLATGEAVGPFAELLERMGVDLDQFNEGLAQAAQNGEAQNYVLQALADTGLSKVNKEYRKNNEELVKSKESAASFQQAIAQMGETLAPIVTKATAFITKLINTFNGLNPVVQKIIIAVTGLVAAIGPLLMVIGSVVSGFTTLLPIIKSVGAAIGVLSSPIALVVAAIIGLVAVIVMNWEQVKTITIKVFSAIENFLISTWNGLLSSGKSIFQTLSTFFATFLEGAKSLFTTIFKAISAGVQAIWNGLKSAGMAIFDGLKAYFSTVFGIYKSIFTTSFNAIKSIVTTVLGALKSVVTTGFNFIKNAISSVLNSAKNIVSSIWGGISSVVGSTIDNIRSVVSSGFSKTKNTISNIMQSVKDLISNIWSKITGGLRDKISNFTSIGKDLIKGLINGVKNMATSLIKSVKGVVGDAVQGAKNLLGINSPSKVFMEIGEFTGEGLAIGMESMKKKVAKAGERMGKASIPNTPTLEPPTPFMNNNNDPSIEGKGLPEGASHSGDIIIQNMQVQKEADIKKIARELYNLQRRTNRGVGLT